MSLPPIAHPERVASASIRGYLFQTVAIARLWLELGDDECLLCEGDEDADRFLLIDGVAQEVTQEQFKDLVGTVSVRAAAVQESIFNFLRAYRRHAEAGRRTRFIFKTSAERARQHVDDAGDATTRALTLSIDVLKHWQTLPMGDERREVVAKLVEAIKRIVASAAPSKPVDDKETKAHRDYRALEDAVAYLDATQDGWARFVDAVDWRFGERPAREQMHELEQALARDDRTSHLPSGVLAQRLVIKVLEASAEDEAKLRVLRRTGIRDIADMSEEELQTWSTRARAERVNAWMIEVDQRLNEHERRLNDHETRIENGAKARVLARSRRAETALAQYGKLRAGKGSAEVRLVREVIATLAEAALAGSLALVGAPGAGKSGVLSALASRLRTRGNDVLVLSAESAHDLGDELLDVVEAWEGPAPAVLIVDALDGLRDDSRARALRERLSHIVRENGRWRVVVSIRAFDLYQGTAIAQVFAGTPPTRFRDARFATVRHVAIGDLTADEMQQLKAAAPNLADLALNAPDSVQRLLRNPFNLSLAAELLSAGTTRNDLEDLTSQSQLLELYWRRRVSDVAAAKDAREAVVREACDRMIRDRRLYCVKARLDPSRVYDLLTLNVMCEPSVGLDRHDDGFVAFSHHLLFDYAVAKLWLPSGIEELTSLLVHQPELLLLVRPSLEMALHEKWHADSTRQVFWEALFCMCREADLRTIGRILGPTVAVSETVVLSDLEPLLAALRSRDSSVATTADEALGYLLGALLPRPRDGRGIAGAQAGPWVELAGELASMDRPMPRHCVRRILLELTERPDALTQPQATLAGVAARALFSATNRLPGVDTLLRPDAIRLVCRTFATDADASAVLIRSLLDPASMREDGYTWMPTLAREIVPLLADPQLAFEIYATAFGTVEQSTAATNWGGGVLLSLTSNRRQDYDGALYALKETFPKFLATSPEHATRALIRVLAAHIEREHRPHSGEIIEKKFSAGVLQGTLRADYSSIWDRSGHVHELEMLDAWQRCLERLAADVANASVIGATFEQCVRENRAAILWCRWLRVATRQQGAALVGPVVLPLLTSPHVLIASDTAHAAGEALKVQFPLRTVEERHRIETAILATRDLCRDDESADRACARLLGCGDAGLLVTSECRDLANDLQSRSIVVPNVPPVSFTMSFGNGQRKDPDSWLRDQGVPVDEEPQRSVLDATRALAAKGSGATDLATATQVLDEAAALVGVVQGHGQLHQAIADEAWSEVARTLGRISADEAFVRVPTVRDQILRISATVAACPCPRSTGRAEQQHEQMSWGSYHARGDVGEALTNLALVSASEPALSLLEQLARDEVGSVRYQTVARLGDVVEAAPEVVWRIAEQLASYELLYTVMTALVASPMGALSARDPERTTHLLETILSRVDQGPTAKDVRLMAYGILFRLHLGGRSSRASTLVHECTTRPASDDAEALTRQNRDFLTYGPLVGGTQKEADVRGKAQGVLSCMVECAATHFFAFRRAHADEIPEDVREHGRALVHRLESAAKQIYFASGAYEAKHPQGDCSPKDPQLATRLFDELEATIELLASTGLPSVVHSVIETLEYCLAWRPERAFLLVVRAVQSARVHGYEFDHLAASLVVRVCTRFLAEHRALVQQNTDVRTGLLDVLDLFVAVGWAEARDITYGLQDVFR